MQIKKMFISYSHADRGTVKKFALQLSLRGYDLWMDEKDIPVGSNYTTKIFQGIRASNIYLVFISKNSIKSNWVEAEVDFALQESINQKNLVIVPILLDDAEMPVLLSNKDYIDARFSIHEAAESLIKQLNTTGHKILKNRTGISITSISFTISDKTPVQIGPFNEGLTTDDLE